MSWTQEELLRLLDTIQEGVFVVDKNNRITFFNHAAESITATDKSHAIGRLCWEVLRADCCGQACPLRQTLATGELFLERPVVMINARGVKKNLSIATTLLCDSEGNTTGAIETFRDISCEEAEQHTRLSAHPHHNIITISPNIQKLITKLPLIADSNSTVLLQGESGTGKEVFAQAIHDFSPRKNGPFIAVNCGALPDNLLESELFGYKKGAFTDAKKDKPGRFALAKGGTILLDEIGETPPAMQVKLLRVIQEKVFEPLGSRKSEYADVRIIAATNKDLQNEVQKGQFRQDLFYRLNVVSITIPPLRERKEDIPVLVDYFIDRLNKSQRKRIRGVEEETMTRLMAYDFPGNVRELENAIEHAFVMCRHGYIQPRHLPEIFGGTPLAGNIIFTKEAVKGIELAHLITTLKRNKWDRQKTAKMLGIHRSTLFRKMRSLGISPPPEVTGKQSH
ncbi:MAG: sigma 54-interacting transcriptional regulator [Chitinispirillaceae bacterium]|nr:sigma 54-interacting transcriptional regulator [Chitinispirillaceae bacterium]